MLVILLLIVVFGYCYLLDLNAALMKEVFCSQSFLA